MKAKLLGAITGLTLLAIMSAAILASPGREGTFSIQASPPTAVALPGGPWVHYTVVVNAAGYSGTVMLNCQPTLPNVACSASPSSIPVNGMLSVSATVSAAAASNASVGSYPLIITATPRGGNYQKTAIVTLLVTPKV